MDLVSREIALAAKAFYSFRVYSQPPGNFQDAIIVIQYRHIVPNLMYIMLVLEFI
jgi:hypothetical protein